MPGGHAVESGEGLHGVEPLEGLVDEHRVEVGLVEAGLELLGDDEDLVVAGAERVGTLEPLRGLGVGEPIH